MMSQVKLRVSRTKGEGGDIVGILQRSGPTEPAEGLPVAVIIHGILSHKDQSFHRGLAGRLASEQGIDSFRYDLTGQGGETTGPFGMANFDDDVNDLERVIEFLRETYGYKIHVLIAHSRGSIFSSYYLSSRSHIPIPYFVNVSGRFHMAGLPNQRRAKYSADFSQKGHSDWHVKIAGVPVVRQVTREGSAAFANWDNSYMQRSFPKEMHVLNVHGDADEVVPITDAVAYQEMFSARAASSTLVVVPNAGHNYIRPFVQPTAAIVDWIKEQDAKKKLPRPRL